MKLNEWPIGMTQPHQGSFLAPRSNRKKKANTSKHAGPLKWGVDARSFKAMIVPHSTNVGQVPSLQIGGRVIKG